MIRTIAYSILLRQCTELFFLDDDDDDDDYRYRYYY